MDLERLASQYLFAGKTLDERIKFYKEPSLSIAVIENGEIATLCRGYRDRESVEKVNTETMFQSGSISKPFFAAAVMKLARKGVLNLDWDIREYGKYEFYETYDNKQHKVTMRQLLSHTAGFDLHGFAGYMMNQKVHTIMEILKGQDPANNLPLAQTCEPGTQWSYSGGGYMLAQKVIEDITQKSTEDIISEEIFLPFGLQHSTFKNPSDDSMDNYAKGIDMFNQCIPGGYCIMPETAAAGLWTTPTDITKFGMELMKACFGRSDVFEQESISEMLKQGLPDTGYGMGLYVPKSENENKLFKHTGANWGYRTSMSFHGKEGRGYVAMLNSEIAEPMIDEIDLVLNP